MTLAPMHSRVGWGSSSRIILSFPSGGTGSVVDDDLGIRCADWDLTTDQIENNVDVISRDMVGVLSAMVVLDSESPQVAWLKWIKEVGSDLLVFDLDSDADLGSDFQEHRRQRDAFSGPETPEISIRDALLDIKSSTGLSSADAARMVGIGRRQFYNLLNGQSTRSETERRIRLVANHLTELSSLLPSSDQAKSAILAPIGADSTSYFDAAEVGNFEFLRDKFRELRDRIAKGDIRYMRRAVPRKASAELRRERRRRVLEDLAG